MAADLNVTIGADLTAYKAGMQQAGSIAANTSNEITKDLGRAAQSTTALGGSAISTSMKFMQMRSGISAARDGVMAFTLGGQAADRSLMAMGHHINSLVNETGSFKGAMGALASSLWGPGGIILGITVAYELYKHFAKQTHEAAEESKNYADTLEGVASARLKGEEAGAKEEVRLKILYDATQNHALSLRDRNKAYDELEAKYPQFFSNAEREKTLLGQNAAAYNALAFAILAAASAKAYEERIGENSVKQRDNENRITDIQIAKEKAMAALVEARRNANAPTTSGGAGGSSAVGYAQIESGLEKEITEYTAQQTHWRLENNKLAKENLALSNLALNSEQQAGFKQSQQLDEKAKKVKEGFAIQEALIAKLKIDLENAVLSKNPTLIYKLGQDLDVAEAKLKLLKAEFDNAKFLHGGELTQIGQAVGTTAVPAPQGGAPDFEKDLKTLKESTEAFAAHTREVYMSTLAKKNFDAENKRDNLTLKELTKTIGGGLMAAFQSALSGTQSFVSAMGQFLLQLIEKLIAAAAAAAILAVLLNATGFGSLFGGGANFSSIFGSLSGLSGLAGGIPISKHAEGGIFTSARVGMFAEAGPEAIVTPQHLADFAGINTENNKPGALVATYKMQGADFLVMINRAQKQKGRTS